MLTSRARRPRGPDVVLAVYGCLESIFSDSGAAEVFFKMTPGRSSTCHTPLPLFKSSALVLYEYGFIPSSGPAVKDPVVPEGVDGLISKLACF